MEITTDTIHGHYEGDFFLMTTEGSFQVDSPSCLRRLRAVIQLANNQFATKIRKEGSKYTVSDAYLMHNATLSSKADSPNSPIHLSRADGLAWVSRVLLRSRGREPMGNYNPLVVGELFWEQSSKWKDMAEQHLFAVSAVCEKFFDILLQEKCPKDVYARLSETKVSDVVNIRQQRSHEGLERLINDKQDFPAIYDPGYAKRLREARRKRMEAPTTHARLEGCRSDHMSARVDIAAAVRDYGGESGARPGTIQP